MEALEFYIGDTLDTLPSSVCKDVQLADGSVVAVTPRPIELPDNGVTMHEYVTPEGEVRANLLSLEPHTESPAWYVKTNAADGQYYKTQYVVAGTGGLDVWYQGNWMVVGQRAVLPDPAAERAVHVIPGDTVRLRAGQLGLHVLALFPNAPFLPDYEERVAIPGEPFPAGR